MGEKGDARVTWGFLPSEGEGQGLAASLISPGRSPRLKERQSNPLQELNRKLPHQGLALHSVLLLLPSQSRRLGPNLSPKTMHWRAS